MSKSEKITSAFSYQLAGKHYTQGIQPVEYCHSHNFDFFEGCILKYLSRHRSKNGAEDIRKIIHYAQFMLELEYGVKSSKLEVDTKAYNKAMNQLRSSK